MLNHLRSLAPEAPQPRSEYAVQGRIPQLVLQPKDREQAAEVLAVAHAHRLAVVPWGGGSQQDFGYPPERIDIVLDLRQLRRVVAYQPADLTVTVEAGCTPAELQTVLAEQDQVLPLDPPRPERATLGGLLATNTNGPLRYGNGTWRDLLLGLRFLRADGTLIKSGGQVVKNVAGLDLGKLFVGSLGTLGVLVEATFKLQPRPPAARLLHLSLPSPTAAEEAVAALMETPLLPSLIELRGGRAGNRGASGAPRIANHESETLTSGTLNLRHFPGWELFVGFEGPEETVAWEAEELRRAMSGPVKVEVTEVEPEAQAAVRRELADFPAAVAPEAGRVSLRASMLGSAVADFCQRALDQAAAGDIDFALQSAAGNGIVHVHLDWGEEVPLQDRAQRVQQLCEAAVAGGGNLIVTAAPPELKPDLPVWGAPRDDFLLMRRVRDQMDPHRLLNPGRFVGQL